MTSILFFCVYFSYLKILYLVAHWKNSNTKDIEDIGEILLEGTDPAD